MTKRLSNNVAQVLLNGISSSDILADLQKLKQMEQDLLKLKQLDVKETIQAMQRRYGDSPEPGGLPTGIKELDKIADGLLPSTLTLVAARRGDHATDLCLTIASHVGIKCRKPVAIFNFDEAAIVLSWPIISAELKDLPHPLDFPEGQLPDLEIPKDVPIFLDAPCLKNLTQIEAACHQLKKREPGLSLVIIDGFTSYLHCRRAESLHVPEMFSWQLKQLARVLDVPVLTTARLFQPAYQRRLDDDELFDINELREIGFLNDFVDTVLFAECGDSTQHVDIARVQVAKSKWGFIGDVDINYDRVRRVFTEREVSPPVLEPSEAS